ncbi:hypothetical protein TraAM80_01876 [Trypanosoma rangeli]|uniref:CNNM transmembrane domain-containing protein n=1 Tax=Trypanosoma rangeli TaxID=5698 RepID=A0A3R7M693_TRYRA|nr:uncharacterized protein TraAM80_01876 [Trypanosoma rangeli]RNF09851.1 hypothetical protein TraAM80_01876 [Trypanosoma rangeli]|eukprot:RNF09851.1 hypothetical protein TraAM80_01876 [Trypanosoma rangeli]
MVRRQLGLGILFLWLCVVATEEVAGEATAATRHETHATDYASWPFVLLFVILVFNVLLAAMFAGLTIGFFGMNFITLEIVSSAGNEPDSTYAKKILPIRRYGHQLLATLLIGNMLTMVVISQMVAAVIQSTELVNFAVATALVFICAEIIPMGICNKGPYALWIGAKSVPIVSVVLFVLYPVAKPLSMFLECIVTHDEGLVYDRNELKKLIHVHCKKYGHESGLGDDEMRMIIGALEMHDVNLTSILKPLDKVLLLPGKTTITRKLMEKLWTCGRSRLPVYSGDAHTHITGILFVRSLITITAEEMENGITVQDVVNANPHDIVIVPETMSLHELLKIFLSGKSQLVFVEGERKSEGVDHSLLSKPNTVTAVASPREGTLGGRQSTMGTTHTLTGPQIAILTSQVALESRTATPIIGIVTLEDVIERFIKADIYDEYDWRIEEERGGISEGQVREEEEEKNSLRGGRFGVQSRRDEFGEHISDHAVFGGVPRANFYSYTVGDKVGNDAMTRGQKVTLANFFLNSYAAFATWTCPQMERFLSRIGDCVVRLDAAEMEGPVLYRCGERSDAFTLLLSGGVSVSLCNGAFATERRSFSAFGEDILLHEGYFTPDYTAIVSRTSRYIRFTIQDFLEERQRVQGENWLHSATGPIVNQTDVEERRCLDGEDLPFP